MFGCTAIEPNDCPATAIIVRMKARFIACPIVWKVHSGGAVAVFLDREVAEATVNAAPQPATGEWTLMPMNELEVLAWLRERRGDGVTTLFVDPTPSRNEDSVLEGYGVNLPELLDSGKTLKLLTNLADLHDADVGESSGA
jgi:hypothetical protein